ASVGIGRVEGDEVRHGAHSGALGPIAQVSIEVVLELVEIDDGPPFRLVASLTLRIEVEDGSLGARATHPAYTRHIGTHQRRPGSLKHRHHIAHHGGGPPRHLALIPLLSPTFALPPHP